MSDADQSNPLKSAPYVLEALVDLIRRVHKDPVYRNIYINPRRADQVLVASADGSWSVKVFAAMVKSLFDRVADEVLRIITSDDKRKKLSVDIQGASSCVPTIYLTDAEQYVNDGKAMMAAHLSNMRPTIGPLPSGRILSSTRE